MSQSECGRLALGAENFVRRLDLAARVSPVHTFEEAVRNVTVILRSIGPACGGWNNGLQEEYRC
jgi:hypothetical protein